jgi:phosphonate transport system substrate-binding protein
LRPARYQNKPIYFSDVIVQADSPVRRFNDLQGKTWAYNEPDSHSGYLITLFHLLATHRTPDFFSKRIRTDFHQNSIQSVAEGVVDASAIDSHVLTIYMRDHPELLSKIRVIDTLGPSTIQPLVACSHIAETLREDVIQIVTGLDSDIHSALERALVSRFIPIKDHDYDDIRAMLASVEAHHFSL